MSSSLPFGYVVHTPIRAVPVPTPQTIVPADGCLDPAVLSGNPEPEIARPMPHRARLPTLPSPGQMGIPRHALPSPSWHTLAAPPIPASMDVEPGKMPPFLHRAVANGFVPQALRVCLAWGERVGVRVPDFRGHTGVDAIGIALLTGQGFSAFYLCAYELGRLTLLPNGCNAAALLARSAALGDVATFARVLHAFDGYMRGVHGHHASPDAIAREAQGFARAANGYAMLAPLMQLPRDYKDLQDRLERAQTLGALTGLDAELPAVRRRLEGMFQHADPLYHVALHENSDAMQDLLAQPVSAETLGDLIDLL